MKSQKGVFVGVIVVVLGFGVWALLRKSGNDQSMMSSTDQLRGEGAVTENTEMMGDDGAKSDDAMMNEDVSPKDDAMMPEKENTKMPLTESAGQYADYVKSAFDQAAGKRRVLFFYANWCPICRPADADIREHAMQLPADVAVFRVNYNDTDTDSDEKALAKEYGITYQHTFVQIDGDGAVVTKWNGGKMLELLNNIK